MIRRRSIINMRTQLALVLSFLFLSIVNDVDALTREERIAARKRARAEERKRARAEQRKKERLAALNKATPAPTHSPTMSPTTSQTVNTTVLHHSMEMGEEALYFGTDLIHSPDHYPNWSWDHVHNFAIVRRKDAFDSTQIAALAKQDIVILEKFTGHETFGSTEAGALVAAKAIKAVNPNVTILFYLNAMVHYKGYAANAEWKEEWAMDYLWRKRFPSYDHTNLEFREWWIQRALDMVAHDEIDGVFIDGIRKTNLGYLPVGGKKHGMAYLATAHELRDRLPEGKLLIGNALRQHASPDRNGIKDLEYLDGSYLENWDSGSPATLDLMTTALQQNKIVMLRAKPKGFDSNTLKRMRKMDDRYEYLGRSEFLDYQLGYFLLIVEPHAHFSYNTDANLWPRRMNVFDNTRFEQLMRKLGKPVGSYQKEGDVFTREFEYLKVSINMQTKEAVLTVKDK